jgi:hypothetical protein
MAHAGQLPIYGRVVLNGQAAIPATITSSRDNRGDIADAVSDIGLSFRRHSRALRIDK